MNQEIIARTKRALQKDGTALLPIEESFLSVDDFNELEDLFKKLPQEFVEVGDAGEPNHVLVGRFLTDVDKPRRVNGELSDRAAEIVTSSEAMASCCKLLEAESLYLRRMQVNTLQEGSFVGQHLDKDSNPDYEVAIVLQYSDDYQGGEFIVHSPDQAPKSFKTYRQSMTITKCSLPHEVTKITQGERISLVYFLSEHPDVNRRYNPDN